MFQGDPGAAINGLEANLYLRVIDVVAGVAVQKYKAFARLPHNDAAAFEALASGVVIYLQPATADTGLNTNTGGPFGIVPVDGAWPPPPADFLGEDREGSSGIDGYLDSSCDDVG